MGLATADSAAFGTPRIDRADMKDRVERVLHRGGRGNPDVLLVRDPSGRYVVKDFSPRSWIVRRFLGRRLLRREARAYAQLAGHDCIPAFLGWVDADAFVLEYRPGVLLSRSLAGRVPPTFFEQLAMAIDEMHAAGVVHLDLRHRSNILASDLGRPVLLDFASAMRFDPDRWSGRLGLRLLRWIDLRALEKWRVRLVPETCR